MEIQAERVYPINNLGFDTPGQNFAMLGITMMALYALSNVPKSEALEVIVNGGGGNGGYYFHPEPVHSNRNLGQAISDWWNRPKEPPLLSLIKTCQNDATACARDSSERRAALQEIASDLKRELSYRVSSKTRIQDCYDPDRCGVIDSTTVHSREKQAAELIHSREKIDNWVKSFFVPPEWKNVQEFLRFRIDDPREKVLFATAESDHNGALKPGGVAGILSQLSQKYDLKYMVFKDTNELKAAVESAANTGRLTAVVTEAHGNPTLACINNCDKNHLQWDEVLHKYRDDYDEIFKGLEPNGKIVLISCSTGASKDKKGDLVAYNLAQSIADQTKKTVVAPQDLAYPMETSLISKDVTMLYHPKNRLFSAVPFYNSNLFKAFKADFKNCSSIQVNEISNKDLKGNEVIRENLDSKYLLTDKEKQSAMEFLGVCEDDPREKFLFFAANTDIGAMEPRYSAETLGVLADQFDLRYKTVSSYEEICEAIEKTSVFGTVAGIAILGSPTSKPGEEVALSNVGHVTSDQNHFSCFSKVKENGTILLVGGSAGQQISSKANLAQKIADDSKRTVIAPTCPVFPRSVAIQSIQPLKVRHPELSYYRQYMTGCQENNENLFKTFNPQTNG